MEKLVRVEIGNHGLPIRIFRKDKKWLSVDLEKVIWISKSDAVGLIRLQVFQRAGGSISEGQTVTPAECEECGRLILWERERKQSMEMHEKVFKGRGGEVSLENCLGLCRDCHTGSPTSKHGDRRWQSAKLRS